MIGSDGKVFRENAEQLNNTLPDDIKPNVAVMNPPFSQTAGRMGDRKVPMVAADHIEQALKRLEPGGRLVAIVGRGMTVGQPTYRAWWSKIGAEYTVRANIGVDGKVYEKYWAPPFRHSCYSSPIRLRPARSATSRCWQTRGRSKALMRLLEPIRKWPALPQNNMALNRAALKWLKEAESAEPDHYLHLPEPGALGTGEMEVAAGCRRNRARH